MDFSWIGVVAFTWVAREVSRRDLPAGLRGAAMRFGPALLAGIAAVRFGLPPMVGYLLCGVVLNLSGVYDYDRLTMIGDLGVTLLLFTIGLKLDVRSLFRPVIWAGTTLHTTIVIGVLGTLLYWLSLAGVQAFATIDLGKAMLIGFALSFSSTVEVRLANWGCLARAGRIDQRVISRS